MDDPPGFLKLLGVMGHLDDRHPVLFHRVDQLVDDALARFVQAGGHFVQQQDLGREEEVANQGHPLLFPSGQLADFLIHIEGRQIHPREEAFSPDGVELLFADFEGEREIVFDRLPEKDRLLETVGDPPAIEGRIHSGDVRALEEGHPGSGGNQACHDFEDGAFTAPGWAGQSQEVVLFHGKADFGQDVRFLVSHSISDLTDVHIRHETSWRGWLIMPVKDESRLRVEEGDEG